MITIEQVSDCRDELLETSVGQVIHSTLGRVRVRILWLQDYPSLHQRIETAIAALGEVTKVYLNPITSSVTVYYQGKNTTEENFRQNLLKLIYQVTPITWLSRTKMPQANEFTSNPPSSVNLHNKLQEVGGQIIGSSVGRVMGVSVGSVTGVLLLGPLGLIAGGAVGIVLGRAVGGQVGAEIVRDWQKEGTDLNSRTEEDFDPLSQVQNTLERGGSEIIAEAVGGLFGVMIGSATLGPAGSVLGSIVGSAIGSQLNQELWSSQSQEAKKIST